MLTKREQTRLLIRKQRALYYLIWAARGVMEPGGANEAISRGNKSYAMHDVATWAARAARAGATDREVLHYTGVGSWNLECIKRHAREVAPWSRDPEKAGRVWDLCNEWEREKKNGPKTKTKAKAVRDLNDAIQ